MDTLDCNGVEKALGDWGVELDWSFEFQNKGRGTVSLSCKERFDAAAPQFAYDSRVKLWVGRTAVGSGGTLFFQGFVGEPVRVAQGAREAVGYELRDAWWKFERQTFIQPRNVYASGGAAAPVFIKVPNSSEVYYGQRFNASTGLLENCTNGETIAEIVAWMNESFNPTRRGAASGQDPAQDLVQLGAVAAAAPIPVTRSEAVKCSEAISACLRWSPDCVVQMDHSTTPPTLSVVSLAGAEEVVLVVADQDVQDTQICTKQDRQLPGVILFYKRPNTVDGVVFLDIYIERADAGGSDMLVVGTGALVYRVGAPAVTAYTPDVDCHTIDIEGSSATRVRANVVAAAVAPAVSGSAAQRLAYWQARDKSLSDPLIDPATLAVTAATATDDSGAAVDLGLYPNETQDTLYSWMGVRWTAATVAAEVTFKKYTDTSRKVLSKNVSKRRVHARRVLTNAVSQTYVSNASFSGGEPVPTGLAPAVYASVAALQQEGRQVLREASAALAVTGGVRPGVKLKLVTAANSYSNLLVQSVKGRPGRGVVEVQFGPSAPLDARDLVNLALATRFRTLYNIPSGRDTATAGGNSSADLAGAAGKDNLFHGPEDLESHAATAVSATDGVGNPTQYSQALVDAAAKKIVLQLLKTDGTVDPAVAASKVDISLGDLVPSVGAAAPLVAKFQQFVGTDGNKHYVLATAAVTGGNSSYKRDYDPLVSYAFGDVVRVRSGNSQGIWVCVAAAPITGQAPVWPEPAAPNWEMLAFGVQSANNCLGTSGSIQFNGQPGL